MCTDDPGRSRGGTRWPPPEREGQDADMTHTAPVGTRTLGREGLVVSAIGLGCMGMSQSYGAADRDESLATVRRALDLGVTFLDTSDVYGSGHNEELVGEAIAGRRDEVQLPTNSSSRTTAAPCGSTAGPRTCGPAPRPASGGSGST